MIRCIIKGHHYLHSQDTIDVTDGKNTFKYIRPTITCLKCGKKLVLDQRPKRFVYVNEDTYMTDWEVFRLVLFMLVMAGLAILFIISNL